VPFLQNLEIFYLSLSSLAFGGFYYFFLFMVAQLHACAVCFALPAGLAVIPTQGSYFGLLFLFLLFLENKYALTWRG